MDNDEKSKESKISDGDESHHSTDSLPDEKEQFQNDSRSRKLKLVKVRFAGNPRAHTYRIGNEKYSYGERIIANSDRGVDLGHISSFVYERIFTIPFDPIDKIIRKASAEDIEKYQELENKKNETKEIICNLVLKHALNMVVSHITFTQWGKKLIIYYTAPERIDFRELIKDLANSLRLQIEMRQISLVDRMIAIGGLTLYGEEYSEYSLKKYED